mmetsp:Transcript_40335/g.29735  ORF Transcript_40335/g.29735 Transcript_40335/m.29735 type:complete len:80 (+) Transcript_40335:82-321(+)
MCNSNKCEICECSDNEIPAFWKSQQQSSLHEMFNHNILKGGEKVKQCPESPEDWCAKDEDDPKSIFVNLVKNKESYTAY